MERLPPAPWNKSLIHLHSTFSDGVNTIPQLGPRPGARLRLHGHQGQGTDTFVHISVTTPLFFHLQTPAAADKKPSISLPALPGHSSASFSLVIPVISYYATQDK